MYIMRGNFFTRPCVFVKQSKVDHALAMATFICPSTIACMQLVCEFFALKIGAVAAAGEHEKSSSFRAKVGGLLS